MTRRIAIIGHVSVGMAFASALAEALLDIEDDVEIVDAEVHELRCPDPVPVPSARELYLERRPRQAPTPKDQYRMRGAYRR